MSQLSFKKDLQIQNILFDEYASQMCHITIICLNFDAQGTALCRCDGQIQEINLPTIRKIIFGLSKSALENYLQAIFDPNYFSEDLHHDENDQIIFRLPELQKLKRYDITNLAKQSLKNLKKSQGATIHYFIEQNDTHPGKDVCCPTSTLYGNTNSRIFHKTNCQSFNAITCTALFNSHTEAVAADFKPCQLCKP